MRRAAARSSARGRDRGDDGDVAVAGEMGGDFGQPADVLAAVRRGEAEIAVEAGAQRIAVEQHRRAAIAEQPAFQRARQRRFAGTRQSRQPDHRAVVAIARRAFVGAQRGFHRHDIDGNGALSGIDRQHQAAAGDAAVDLDHQPSGARIVGIGIGGQRLRQRDIDLADMVARDRLGLHAREFAGIDGLLDRDHGGAGFPGAEPDQDRGARRQRLVVQPENPRAKPAGVARAAADMGDDVAALDEQFAVERDADRAAGGLRCP